MRIGHGATSRPECNLNMGLNPSINSWPPGVLLGGTYDSYATIPAVHGREVLVGLWRGLRGGLGGDAHIQTVTSVGRVEAIGGHSTQGGCEERGERYGNCVKSESATSKLALTRNGETPEGGGVACYWW